MAFIEPMHRNKPNITYLLTRRRHYDVTDLNQLFKTVSSKRILNFVKDIGLYNSL